MQQLPVFVPSYNLKKTRFLYADNLIGEELLGPEMLDISDSCCLRRDRYHCMNNDFPDLFGEQTWTEIRPYVGKAISGTKEEWTQNLNFAKQLCYANHAQYQDLCYIQDNYKQYSMWYLKKFRNNLCHKGSVPAEQNHSSLKALLGKGGTLDLLTNVKKLLERQHQLNAARNSKRNELHLVSDRYRGKKATGYDNIADIEAKKVLSKFAYEEYKLILSKSTKLCHHVGKD